MSDQYTPPRPTPPRSTTAAPVGEGYRSEVRIDNTTPAPPSSGGFGSGMLVAAVFVVIAILAAVLFTNRDRFGMGSSTAPAAVTIENNASPSATAPAADAPAAQAPAADTPAVVAPVAPAEPAPSGTVVEPVVPTPAPAAPAVPANP